MSPNTIIILAVLAAVAAFTAVYALTSRAGLPGPVFWFELVRVTRKGLHARFRSLLGLILLVCLYLLYVSWFPTYDLLRLTLDPLEPPGMLSFNDMASFAESFFMAYLMVQMAAVVLLTPAYAANAITEEKQRRTLELLLAAGMAPREIVLGKFLSRLTHIGGILLAGLPILALTMFFGGVDLTILATAYVGTLMTMLSLGGVATACAVTSKTLGKALSRTYSITGLPFLVALFTCVGWVIAAPVFPFSYIYLLFNINPIQFFAAGLASHWVLCGIYVVFHGLVAVISLTLAVRRLRFHVLGESAYHWVMPAERERRPRRRPPQRRLRADSDSDEVELVLVEPGPRTRPQPRPKPRPRSAPRRHHPRTLRAVADLKTYHIGRMEPLLWKERFFGQGQLSQNAHTGPLTVVVICFFVIAVVFLAIQSVLFHQASQPLGPVYNPLIRLAGGALLALLTISAGSHVVSTVTREREQQTLDGLLTLPVERSRILRAKLLGAWYRFRTPAGLLVAAVLVGLPTGGLHPVAVALSLALVVAVLGFSAVLALWLSVRCQSTARAATYWGLGLLAIAAVPPLFGMLAEAMMFRIYAPRTIELVRSAVDGVSPVMAWVASTFYSKDIAISSRFDAKAAGLVSGVTCSAVLGLATLMMWASARRRFEREGDLGPRPSVNR